MRQRRSEVRKNRTERKEREVKVWKLKRLFVGVGRAVAERESVREREREREREEREKEKKNAT